MAGVTFLANAIIHELTFRKMNCQFQEIMKSSFDLKFTNTNIEIVLKLSTHHLDVPWKIDFTISAGGKLKGNAQSLSLEQNNPTKYQVNPKMLVNEAELSALAELIAQDVENFLSRLSSES